MTLGNGMDNTKEITVLSLCAGYGGLELGLSEALARPLRVVALEIEAYALANLVSKAEEGKLGIEALWPDLKTFPAEKFRGCFDFVVAGYPCQPFSVAGKRQGTDDPRHLWPHIARIVQAVEPLWCFFENVPGHLTLGFGEVYCSLRDMGYAVEAGLFTAAECGVAMRGIRLFILATSNSNINILTLRQHCEMEWVRPIPERCEKEFGFAGILQPFGPPRPCKVGTIPRMVDGTSRNVDRLRLLGNGVVPHQAAKAFRMLLKKNLKFEI